MARKASRRVIGCSSSNQTTAAAEVESLTQREREVLEHVMHGLGNKAIADRLGVTVAAVKWHLQHIYDKLHVHSRTEAALKFRKGQSSGN